MYRLTDRRLESARPILEKYRAALIANKGFHPGSLEQELRQCFAVGGTPLGYQSLKDIMIDMLKRERYRHVALYYMEHQNPTGPVSEFQGPLARAFSMPQYDRQDREGKRKQFWGAFFSGQEENSDD
jgi:hypothetical protein